MPAVFQCGSIIWQEISPDAYQCLDICSPSADIRSTSGIPKECSIHTYNSNTYTHHSAVFIRICTMWIRTHTNTQTDTHTHRQQHLFQHKCLLIKRSKEPFFYKSCALCCLCVGSSLTTCECVCE